MALDNALPLPLMAAAFKLLAIGVVAVTAIEIHYRKRRREGRRYGR